MCPQCSKQGSNKPAAETHRCRCPSTRTVELVLSTCKPPGLVKFLLSHSLIFPQRIQRGPAPGSGACEPVHSAPDKEGWQGHADPSPRTKETQLFPASQILCKIIRQLCLYCYPAKRIWRNKRNETNSLAHSGAALFTGTCVGKGSQCCFKL